MSLLPEKFKTHSRAGYNPSIGLGLTSLQREMNNLMNNYFDWGGPTNEFYPSVDIRETDNKYFVDADVPGMSDKNLSLDINKNILTISGKVDSETKNKDKGFVSIERAHEAFSREVYLAENVEVDSVKAELKDGVLHIEMNKAEPVKKMHKKIPIKH